MTSYFTFVVWRNDSTCPVLICPGTQDFKELIVAVRLDAAAISYDRPYIELHTRITDPNDSVIRDLPPGGGSTITAQRNRNTGATNNRPARRRRRSSGPMRATRGAGARVVSATSATA